MKVEHKFKKYLKQKSLKFTSERRSILEAIFSLHAHFDVDQLYEKLRELGKGTSRATVYRTIPLLIKGGFIKETLHCQGRVRYEHIYGHQHHDHLICLGCGKVIEFSNRKIEHLQKEMCKKNDFVPIEHRLGIKGYCRKCAKKFLSNNLVNT